MLVRKTDRLGRDRLELGFAQKLIADAGAKQISLSEPMLNDDSPEAIYLEALIEAGAEYYSKNFAKHIRRGMNYNAEHALYNGHKVWGYGVDADKKYVIDNDMAPFVRRMFTEYAEGAHAGHLQRLQRTRAEDEPRCFVRREDHEQAASEQSLYWRV